MSVAGAGNVLSGLRVVELAAFVAAPIAGATLAALGADVIRVEQLGGGIDAKRWPLHDGVSLYRAGLDRGKRSIALDLRSSEGQDLVRRLVLEGGPGGGVVVTNLPEQPWLSYARLRDARADTIVVRIVGAREGRPAVDYTVKASVGFPLVTGPTELSGPVNHVLPAWDVTAGMMAVSAVLAAELHRRATGEGQLVELALRDVAISVARHLGYVDEAALVDEPRPRIGNAIYGAYGSDFATQDGRYIFVCALTSRQWRSLGAATETTQALESLAAASGVDFDTDEGARYEHRAAIGEILTPWFAARPLAEVAAALDSAGALWEPYQTFKELAAAEEPVLQIASPVVFSGFPPAGATAAPQIGADTWAVLTGVLGIDDGGLASLADLGVIE